jgi:hypothetical protein
VGPGESGQRAGGSDLRGSAPEGRLCARAAPLQTRETPRLVTNLTAAQASPARLGDYVRGHWGIEALHPSAMSPSPRRLPGPHRHRPRAMAALRNLAIGILHLRGWHNIAQRCAATPATPPESCHCLASPAHKPDTPAHCRGPASQPSLRTQAAASCSPTRQSLTIISRAILSGKLEQDARWSGVNSTRSLGQIRGLSGHAAEADCAAW